MLLASAKLSSDMGSERARDLGALSVGTRWDLSFDAYGSTSTQGLCISQGRARDICKVLNFGTSTAGA